MEWLGGRNGSDASLVDAARRQSLGHKPSTPPPPQITNTKWCTKLDGLYFRMCRRTQQKKCWYSKSCGMEAVRSSVAMSIVELTSAASDQNSPTRAGYAPDCSALPEEWLEGCTNSYRSLRTVVHTAERRADAAVGDTRRHLASRIAPLSQGRYFLLTMIKDTRPSQLVHFLEYHLLLGFTDLIIFDNSCPGSVGHQDRHRVLRRYLEARVLRLDTSLQCINISSYRRDAYPNRDMRGASGLVQGLVRERPHLNPPKGSLVVAMDDDEYLYSRIPLQQLRTEMLASSTCAHHAYWRTFGSSGQLCPSLAPHFRTFYRRAPLLDELESSKRKPTQRDVRSAMQNLSLNSLFPSGNDNIGGQGKHVQIWSDNLRCGTHVCLATGPCRGAKRHRHAHPDVWVAHYYTQSDSDWWRKRLRGRASGHKSAVAETIPRIYDQVRDYDMSDLVDQILRRMVPERKGPGCFECHDSQEGTRYRSCLARLFAPAEAPRGRVDEPTAEPTLMLDRAAVTDDKVNKTAASSPNNDQQCFVEATDKLRVALSFHGAFRSDAYTLQSIIVNLLTPLHSAGCVVDVFLHSLLTLGEGQAAPGASLAYGHWHPCRFSADGQEAIDSMLNVTKSAGRTLLVAKRNQKKFRANTVSFSRYNENVYANIFRAKYSLYRVANLISMHELEAKFKYTHIVSARPDLWYGSPLLFDPQFRGVRIPDFHHYGGLNDRFAFGDARSMMRFMTIPHLELSREGLMQLSRSSRNDWWWNSELNSEKFLCATMAQTQPPIIVGLTHLCLVRVRPGGVTISRDVNATRAAPSVCERFTKLALSHDYEGKAWMHAYACRNMILPFRKRSLS